MTFGQNNWGATDEISSDIFNAFIEAGGNFVDTADVYSGGKSEELVGKYINARKLRDQVVLATKYSFNTQKGNPNAGGNGRKNLYRAVETSLKRRNTDYIDMYWMHVWDMITPVEEVLHSLGDLIREGKIRYFGLSDIPAWYAAKASAMAKAHNMAAPIAQQMYYALTERTIEMEHIPAALDAGQGMVPWSPLAYGFLTGKYRKDQNGEMGKGNGRLDKYNPMFPQVTEKHWQILDVLKTVSAEVEYSMAQVALAWVIQKKGITSTLLGVSNIDQMQSNINSLYIEFSTEQLKKLDEVSRPDNALLYDIFTPKVNNSIFGGYAIRGWK